MKTIKLVLVMFFSIAIASCGGGGGSSTPPTPPCAAVPGAATVNIGSTTGGTFWSNVGQTQLGFNNTNLNFYLYISGDLIADMGAVCLGDVTTWTTSGSGGPAAYVQDHVYVVEYQTLQYGSLTGIKKHYKFIAGAYSQGSVAITWIPMFDATATTTAQNLTVGTSMLSFSPLTPFDGATPYTYSYTGTLPAGLSFNTSTGVVTGIPTSTYPTANLVFSVKDANNVVASTTSTVSFTVTAGSGSYVVQGGLTWAPVTFSNTWANAQAFCAGTINGQTGWRQPTDVELSALYTSGAMNNQGWTLGNTWGVRTVTRAGPTCIGGSGNYPTVSLINGVVGNLCDIFSAYVSCVR